MPRGDWGDAFANAYNASLERVSSLIAKKNEFDQTMQLKRQEVAKEEAARTAFNNYLSNGGIGGNTGIGVTGMTMDETGKKSLTFGQTPESKVKQEVSAEAGKKSAASERDFLIAKGKLRTTMGAFKAMAEQAGGAGRVAGFKNLYQGATGQNPYVKAYQGQLVEAAASLAKLAAPSARVGQEIIQQFKKTLPTQFSTMPEAVNQIRFSLHNAFATALGQAGQEYTQEIRDQVDGFVKDIVETPALNLNSFNKFKNGKLPEVGSVKNGYSFMGGNPADQSNWEKVK